MQETKKWRKKKMSEDLKTQAECEAAGGSWNEAKGTCTMPHNELKTDADLMRENESLRAKIELREKQLKQAIDIANKANQQQKAKEDAERETLVSRIVIDSNNKFKPEELKDKTLSELRLMQTVIDKSLDQTFASIAAYQADEARRKPEPQVNYWSTTHKEWRMK